jgi:hypothetical protein
MEMTIPVDMQGRESIIAILAGSLFRSFPAARAIALFRPRDASA